MTRSDEFKQHWLQKAPTATLTKVLALPAAQADVVHIAGVGAIDTWVIRRELEARS
jgi:hypothetical protein